MALRIAHEDYSLRRWRQVGRYPERHGGCKRHGSPLSNRRWTAMKIHVPDLVAAIWFRKAMEGKSAEKISDESKKKWPVALIRSVLRRVIRNDYSVH